MTNKIVDHYEKPGMGKAILNALIMQGIDIKKLKPENLYSLDQFHTRGIVGTKDQASLTEPNETMHILDIGCGIGGSARYLAWTYGCRVTGIDITKSFIETAKLLTKKCSLDHVIDFKKGDATDLPFDNDKFDMVWCQNVSMNIERKDLFYKEVARALKPNGRFSSSEYALGRGGSPYYPLPWARGTQESFLISQEEMRLYTEGSGLEIIDWIDKSKQILAVAPRALKILEDDVAGLQLVAGEDIATRVSNSTKSMLHGHIENIMMVAKKPL